MLCPKCKKDLPDEIAFCPYCMTKFAESETYGDSIKIKKRIVPFIVGGVVLVVGVLFAWFLLGQGNGDKDNTRDSMFDYCGTWYNKEFEGETPELDGGNVLKIISINDSTVIFDLCSYQAPPNSRVAEINGVTAEIVDGEAEFIFGNDGWGNGGIGKLVFVEDKIYVNIKLTSISSDSLWSIGTDVVFEKVSETYKNDTIDFMGILGEDIKVALTLLEDMEYRAEEYDSGVMYYFDGIYADVREDKVICMQVDYSQLPEGNRNIYTFSYGVNGNTSFEGLKSKLGEPIYTYEEIEGVYVSSFNVPDRQGEYFKIAYSEGKIVYIMYFCMMD